MLILCSMMLIASKIYCKLTMPKVTLNLGIRIIPFPNFKVTLNINLIILL
jgi:hypothetical protein